MKRERLNTIQRLDLAEARSHNLRQLLLRAHRTVNDLVAEELTRRGHQDIRLIHSRLLENLDREGNSVTAVAKRAQMTKQAMGSLARELEEKGYLRRVVDETDARAWVLRFTPKGWRLMLDSFEIVDQIEHRLARAIGAAQFSAMRTGLAAIADESPQIGPHEESQPRLAASVARDARSSGASIAAKGKHGRLRR